MKKKKDSTKQSIQDVMLDHILPAEPISDNTLTKILHAAHHAPSVGFSQPWNFVLIKDNNTKKSHQRIV